MSENRCVWGRRIVGVLCAVVMCLAFAIAAMGHHITEIRTQPPEVVLEYVEVPVDGVMPFYSQVYMTEEEYELLAEILFLEAGNQSLTGQRCVVEVVFNRVMHPSFPGTVKGVLSQPGQFSTYKNAKIAKPTQEQYDAINAVMASSEPILPSDTIYFATSVANGKLYEKIGGHYFCT